MTDDPCDERRTTEPPGTDDRFPVPLRGVAVDPETRCAHYDAAVDVIALRFPCCDCYYPCFRCHEAVTDHDAERVPREAFDHPAVLCGACGERLSVREYLDCGDACPACAAAFNPGCRRHRDRYFAVEE
ncbi:CHY zinc finger protein [Halosimplex halobium]|uniref:CHY zinc finger protein n=1 Tax=Halosimplex halobium TaxID=3396618 RepID=UPI003F55B498